MVEKRDNEMIPGGIGILGGTFDPTHVGHVAVARAAMDHLGLSRVHLVPANRNPLRLGEKTVADAHHRLVMAHLATLDEPWLFVDPVELQRSDDGSEPSYTIDTLRLYHDRFPGIPLILVVGADNAAFHKWRKAEDFPKHLAGIAVLSRPDFQETMEQSLAEVKKKLPAVHALVRFLPVLDIPVSSTSVRESLRRGVMPADSLHPAVELHIRKYRLYGLDGGRS